MKKKILSLVLALALVLPLVPVFAENNNPVLTTTVDKSSVQRGEEIAISVVLDKNVSTRNIALQYQFDSSAFTYKDKSGKWSNEIRMNGRDADVFTATARDTSAVFAADPAINISAGSIFTMTLTVKDNAPFGTYQIKLVSGELFPATCVAATVTVTHDCICSTYETDDSYHWGTCVVNGCPTPSIKELHGYDNACDTTCDKCGYVRTIVHKYTMQDKNTETHWMKCSVCGIIDESSRKNHSYDHACDTTCNGCSFTRTITHKYSIQQKNSENHWKICSVCRTVDETSLKPHDYSDNCDPYCNTCSYQRTITHDYSTLLNSEFLHWYNCSVCGATNDTSYEEHVYDHACDTICNVCNRERTITHSYSIQDLDDNAHWMKCAFCGGIDENTRTPHYFDNACDTTCNGCSYTRTITHTYDNDCDTTCNVCAHERTITHDYSVQDKNAKNHWMKCSVCGAIDETTRSEHKYDNIVDSQCNECNYERRLPYDAYGTTGECYWYVVNNKLTIFGNGKMGDYTPTIGTPPVPFPRSITHIVIEDGVTYIGSFAFWQRTSLTSITIPESVTEIGWQAFSDCTYLTSITIPNNVTSIGNGAFSACSSLTSVNIGNSVTSIGSSAFSGCKSLTSIAIPDSVTSIGWHTFSGCNSLTSVTIPDSVTSIGSGAFYECKSLASISIPDSVTDIGSDAFYKCRNLTSVIIPDRVAFIGEGTFLGCTSLTSITIPNSVTDIGGTAFYDCSALTDVWYEGSASERQNIFIDSFNESLTSAVWHYVDSDCDTTCNECGAKREPLAPHTYDDAQDTICNICGETKYTPGDVDGVEGVDLNDAIYLLYHVNFADTYPVDQPVDFDSSGEVDLNDAIYLLYHVNFPGSYPLH